LETTPPSDKAGSVAYVPPEGNTNAFEKISCEEAAKRDIACKLGKP
jgi:hypothetical protein